MKLITHILSGSCTEYGTEQQHKFEHVFKKHFYIKKDTLTIMEDYKYVHTIQKNDTELF